VEQINRELEKRKQDGKIEMHMTGISNKSDAMPPLPLCWDLIGIKMIFFKIWKTLKSRIHVPRCYNNHYLYLQMYFLFLLAIAANWMMIGGHPANRPIIGVVLETTDPKSTHPCGRFYARQASWHIMSSDVMALCCMPSSLVVSLLFLRRPVFPVYGL